ncbi:MAG: TraB/GumN family protein [Chitinophagaceae bacterium]|nr:MAG: TraB/GumN family protein [Chitinophagaceae bacterium]
MKRTLLLLAILVPFFAISQPRIKDKKYPSLLWEISGNGLAKTSYLFGTMHVSSKLAFHLADSFYIGIRRADVVALETNPESWQEDMNKYDLGNDYASRMYGYGGGTSDMYFQKSSLQFSKYIPRLEAALSSSPSSINNLLYRSYGGESSDFEEDTFLDMYIYQCGKKWGKKVAGVEHYGESMKLMAEAYRDAAKDKSRKPVRYDGDNDYSGARLQEAYRTGNLDWLDSINKYNSQSDAFDEKFMYRRNEIQSASIDSILKTGQSLFVGVGAAHLPGNRGVIEMLRKMGYKLRPVRMGARDSDHKTQVEKLRVPVTFRTQYATDSFFHADIPGKFYPAGDESDRGELQYADMSNGSYYTVSRIETNGWMWGHSPQRVKAITDSLLYENIPGRIIRKTAITRDGYPGIEIINRTRRGDMQRYNIFFTPFEILVFKMSGTAEYVTQGTEADRYFSSIRLKNFPGSATGNWKTWSPSWGGFKINLPHEPFAADRGRWIFDATDSATNTNYRVIRNDIHNYGFNDEDSFDLMMMEESFASSEFIDKKTSSTYSTTGGYPSLDVKYNDKYGAVYLVRFLIQGPHYYTIIARAEKESPRQASFVNSFGITPFRYGKVMNEKDTSLKFTVNTPYINRSLKEKIDVGSGGYGLYNEDEPGTDDGSVSKARMVSNDSTGEHISVIYSRGSDYETMKDSALLREFSRASWHLDSSRIVRSSLSGNLPGDGKFFDIVLSDSGSSRFVRIKLMYVNGNGFVLMNEGDTLSGNSSFVENFFASFQPADSLRGTDPFASKTGRFFSDFFSSDTILHKKAVKGLGQLEFTEKDFPNLEKAIRTLSYKEKTYLELKKNLIGKLSELPAKQVTDFLKELYVITADTLDLQYAALSNLLGQKTDYSFSTFRDLVVADPPVISGSSPYVSPYQYDNNSVLSTTAVLPDYDVSFLLGLRDSLQLTMKILPDLLPLLNLDDYEPRIRTLVATLADSSLLKPKMIEGWYSKFMLQAKQQLKKQQIAEKQSRIAAAELKKDRLNDEDDDLYRSAEEEYSPSSVDLDVYVSVLLPFYDKQPQVRSFIAQLFAGSDETLKYNLMKRMITLNRPFPDTMLAHFAARDKNRFTLYSDLKAMKKTGLFPAAERTQIALAKSYLLGNASSKPDSLIYIGKLPATVSKRNGMVLFFKYKQGKDDVDWKLANVGLVPSDSTQIEFADEEGEWDKSAGTDYGGFGDYYVGYGGDGYQLGALGSTRITDEEPLEEQLQKELKKILFSTHKSGRMFFYGDKESPYAVDVAY